MRESFAKINNEGYLVADHVLCSYWLRREHLYRFKEYLFGFTTEICGNK